MGYSTRGPYNARGLEIDGTTVQNGYWLRQWITAHPEFFAPPTRKSLLGRGDNAGAPRGPTRHRARRRVRADLRRAVRRYRAAVRCRLRGQEWPGHDVRTENFRRRGTISRWAESVNVLSGGCPARLAFDERPVSSQVPDLRPAVHLLDRGCRWVAVPLSPSAKSCGPGGVHILGVPRKDPRAAHLGRRLSGRPPVVVSRGRAFRTVRCQSSAGSFAAQE